ncbi:MAG TPA: ABC transporter substrate-binding protein [Stellaceae bacterium]|nr:ABC transporter substrate-binding protein [Stellaceae bacterium]
MPFAATAQRPLLPVIGYLGTAGSPAARKDQTAGFREGLAESGYIEGKNAAIAFRWAEDHYDRLPALAADLVRRRVAVIAATNLPSARAAKNATQTIPIVFMIGDDPVKHGLVGSFSHPGGNATGVNILGAGLGAKRLGILRELAPKAAWIALLVNPDNPNAAAQAAELQQAARTVGQRIAVFRANTEGQIETAFAALVERGTGGVIVGADPFFFNRRRKLAALAAGYAVPAIYEWREFVETGGLASYGANIVDAHRQFGIYVGKVLAGAKPADLPVIQPTRFELVINLQTAKVLGLAVPPIVLAQADEVIE